jgi:hypothetical protein
VLDRPRAAHPLDAPIGERCTIYLRNSAHVTGTIASRGNGYMRLTDVVIIAREPDGSVSESEAAWITIAENQIVGVCPALVIVGEAER